jgi:hypothetical protein
MYQSINMITYTNEIHGNKMTQDFWVRFTCFPASYSSLWWYTHLMDCELINYQELNPQRCHTSTHKMGILQATSSIRVANSWTPAGKAQEPLTIAWWGSKQSPITSSTLPLFQAIYSVEKHPRITSNPQQTRRSSATRCNSQCNALESHSISLEYATKQGDEWKRCSLTQRMSQYLRSARDFPEGPTTSYL